MTKYTWAIEAFILCLKVQAILLLPLALLVFGLGVGHSEFVTAISSLLGLLFAALVSWAMAQILNLYILLCKRVLGSRKAVSDYVKQ